MSLAMDFQECYLFIPIPILTYTHSPPPFSLPARPSYMYYSITCTKINTYINSMCKIK